MSGTPVAALRLDSLLAKIHGGLRQSLDTLVSNQANDELPQIDVQQTDIATAVLYLRDLGLANDALRLHGEFKRCTNLCTDEWLAAMADGESEEYRERLTEIFGAFPSRNSSGEQTVEDRRLMIVGAASQILTFVEELIGTVNALTTAKRATQAETPPSAGVGDHPEIAVRLSPQSDNGKHKPVFKKDNDAWLVAYQGEQAVRFNDAKAFADVFCLIQHKGETVSLENLPGNVTNRPTTGSTGVATKEEGKAILEKICYLKAEQDTETDHLVREENDIAISALITQFNENWDRHGNPRELAGDARKMLAATKKRIDRLLLTLSKGTPVLAKHLYKHLAVDSECKYDPESPIEWDLGD